MQCPCVTLRIRRDVREKMLQILNKFTSKQFAVVSLSTSFLWHQLLRLLLHLGLRLRSELIQLEPSIVSN